MKPLFGWRGLSLVSVAVALLLVSVVGKLYFLPNAVPIVGLTIDGIPLTGQQSVDELVRARAEALTMRRVILIFPGDSAPSREVSFGELGVVVDTHRVKILAERAGHEGDWIERARQVVLSRSGRLDIPLVFSIDTTKAIAMLMPLKESLDRVPISARLDVAHDGVLPERHGSYLDIDGSIAAIWHAASDATVSRLEVPFLSVRPRVTTDVARSIAKNVVLGEYETYFSRAGEQARRGHNIETAASKLDGLVISPHEVVSFNGVVGERSAENGFEKSWEIFKGEMIEGIGGGTCQVASTLHAVAFFGGLDIVERLPHSRPSAYSPMGLDSTVVYPIVDLKLRNPFEFAVVVRAYVEGSKLHMELLGARKPLKVAFARELLDTYPYPRKVVEEPSHDLNHVLIKQHGIFGYRLKRSRVLMFTEGDPKKQTTIDIYPPTTEIYEVPVGFDVSRLPALPVEPGTGAGDSTEKVPPSDDLQIEEGRGTHPPTTAQLNPPREVWMTR